MIQLLQLSVSTIIQDHIKELFEAKRKMTRYFKKYYKNGKSRHVNTDNNYPCITQSSSHNPDKHVHKTQTNADHVNKVTGQTQTLKVTKSETEDTIDHLNSDSPISNDYHGLMKLLRLPSAT